MIKRQVVFVILAGFWLSSPQFFAEDANLAGQGHAVLTVLPANPNVQDARISLQDLTVKVNGKQVASTGLVPLRGDQDRTEIVILIDGSARSSLGTQFSDIAHFASEIPTNTKIALAYMENGRALVESQLTANPAQFTNALHVPAGVSNQSANPYFCLSDLAAHWPSSDLSARRIAILVTDGVDDFNLSYDPDDPYVQAAIKDSARAGLQVYSIYWRSRGTVDQSQYENNAGQSLISMVTAATGGHSYWEGDNNPVSFEPFFIDMRRRLRSQYALSFTAPAVKKPELANFELKSSNRSAKIEAPRQVWIGRATEPQK
jgi:uncharacterized Zn-binding protein involved in type VI secretion